MTVELVHADWPAPEGIFAATTTRAGGVSEGPWESLNLAAHAGDRREAVTENRRRLVEETGLVREPVWLQQVHGTRVVQAEDGPLQEADAVISTGRPSSPTVASCISSPPTCIYGVATHSSYFKNCSTLTPRISTAPIRFISAMNQPIQNRWDQSSRIPSALRHCSRLWPWVMHCFCRTPMPASTASSVGKFSKRNAKAQSSFLKTGE